MTGFPVTDSRIQFLSVEDVLGIYQLIVRDFADSDDPIAPAGVRDQGLLESAVYRQLTGFEGHLKYDHPLLSAASLVFGVCCDHPFYNGNKRAALVTMLVHLDRNQYAIPGVTQSDLYDAMLAIADHRMGVRDDGRSKKGTTVRRSADEEVQAIYKWVRRHAEKIAKGERVISYRQLRQALVRFDIEVEIIGANHAELVRYEERQVGLFRKRKERARIKLGKIGYRNEGTDIPRSEVKTIREMCGLTEENGVDSESFYTTGVIVDAFVCRYRRVLSRLAKV